MSNLDMTLDDIITRSKTSRAGPRPSAPGPARRFHDRSASRAAPYSYSTARTPESLLDRGVFAAGRAFPNLGGARVSSIETGTKLLISNLHYGVTDDDIEELFSGVGHLKSCSIHYDRSGRSEGTAEVVFSRRRDAESAIKRYNNVQLDGMPMRIEIVGMNMDLPPVLPPAIHGRYINNKVASLWLAPKACCLPSSRAANEPNHLNARVQGRGGDIRRPQGGVRGMRKDRVGGRGRGEKISAEDLDADLEKYLAGAKDTN
ncbi:hypothetical protein DH2020_025943 [Rehmannia glutinosa]|uniref:RRM domain-containing protein n=1 Tax=Rehmannia glutinosa TaxID=99300 RepID=A0ABR0W151_REHGL